MDDVSDRTTQLQVFLDRMNEGSQAARLELMGHAYQRLERLARSKLHGFPHLRRREETGSILHNALLSLQRSLDEVHPKTVREFFGLASRHIRWILLDLTRAPRAVSMSDGRLSDAGIEPVDDATGPTTNIERLELHELVEALPDESREVVDLLFYQGLPQSEAATLLGVSERTVKRRWRTARLAIQEALMDNLDGADNSRCEEGHPHAG
jgi:RNA polymerase sigma factor (sigma-70 family)